MGSPVRHQSRIIFFIVVGALAAPDCDYFYSENLESEGFVSSYNYPFAYRHNLACRHSFHFKYQDATKICFEFHDFGLEPDVPFCLFDFLEFQSQPPVKYCMDGVWQYGIADSAYPHSTLTQGQSCWIVRNSDSFVMKFSSDNSSNGRGFYASYKILESVDAEVGDENDDDMKMGKSLMKCSFSWESEKSPAVVKDNVVIGNDDGDKEGGSGRCSVDMEGWKKTDSLFLGSTFIDDHTIGAGGSFLLSSKSSRSVLLFPEIRLEADVRHCLTFWFLFASPRSPGLRSYLTRDQMHADSPEWESKPSNATPIWRLAEVDLSGLRAVQVAVATDVADRDWPEGGLGAVGLDDLSISVGRCSGVDISCNFESSDCGWNEVRELSHSEGSLVADGRWERSVDLDGEEEEEEDSRGSHISTLALENEPMTRSLLLGPQVVSALPPSGDPSEPRGGRAWDSNSPSSYHACFEFFYRFSGGSGLSVLNLHLLHFDGYLTRPVWSTTNGVGGKWVSATADLVLPRGRPYKVVFEALLRLGSRVSLDSLRLRAGGGGCQTPTSQCLAVEGHWCAGGPCLEGTSVCDGHRDCPDGSDEDETSGCREGRSSSGTFQSTGLASGPTKTSPTDGASGQGGINVVAASVCAVVLGLLVACLTLCAVCLVFGKKRRTGGGKTIPDLFCRPDVPGGSAETPGEGTGNGGLTCHAEDEGTIYQTLSASNRSSADLCRSEERALRTARTSSGSSDDGDPLPHELDPRALGGRQARVPLIVASKYIISPDRAGSFAPEPVDGRRIERMMEAYRKDIKIPNTNSSARPGGSTRKEFPLPLDDSFVGDHVYEDIDKVEAGFSSHPAYLENTCPSHNHSAFSGKGDGKDQPVDRHQDGGIVSSAILV